MLICKSFNYIIEEILLFNLNRQKTKQCLSGTSPFDDFNSQNKVWDVVMKNLQSSKI